MTDEQILARLAEIEGWRRLNVTDSKWVGPIWADKVGNYYVNPLTGDGDAFRLLEKHKIACSCWSGEWRASHILEDVGVAGPDLKRAICLAVIAANEERLDTVSSTGDFPDEWPQALTYSLAKASPDQTAGRVEGFIEALAAEVAKRKNELESKRNPR